MEERRLGPVVWLGTWDTFGGDGELARDVVGTALAGGSRLFDSSPMYGNAQRSLGAALEGRREPAIVATKIWAPTTEQGRAQFEQQLSLFGRVEIEQVHNLVAWREQLGWLEQAREEGSIDRIGVTHYSPFAFDELAQALRTGRFQAVGLPVIVMRPFAEAELLERAPDADELEPLAPFGIETWPQALLKWVLADERVDVVIPGTRNALHAAQNALAASPPWLRPDERRYV